MTPLALTADDDAPDVAARLLGRLDAIGASLARRGDALALLGLGSVGRETDRIDAWSDLDFFAIVAPGRKAAYLADLAWLSDVAPVAYAVRNTVDGYKVLYEDGIFCEFAVFEPAELPGIAYAPGRVVWAAPGFDTASLDRPDPTPGGGVDVPWALGEALTNLYVGLGRYHRGERLAAARLVQNHAVDRVLELASVWETAEAASSAASRDPFQAERRVERRIPALAGLLPTFVQGYDRTPESARAILGYLETHADVEPHLRAAILALSEPAPR